jgi:hypothetical protein
MKYAIGKPSGLVIRYFETDRDEDLQSNLAADEVAVQVNVIDASMAFVISEDGSSISPVE